jgi:4-carboxymuconolactone decarboxylase
MIDGTTSRIPLVTDRDQLPEADRQNYDRIADPRGGVAGPFGALLNSPAVGGRVGHLGAYLRFESELSGPLRELAVLTTARELDCPYEWAVHEPIAREAGVDAATVEAVATGASLDDAPEPETLVVRYGRKLLSYNRVLDSLYEATKDRLGVRGITELTATIGYYSMLACVLNAFEIVPEGDAPALP